MSSQVELYCHSATCVDIQWNECRASQDHGAMNTYDNEVK